MTGTYSFETHDIYASAGLHQITSLSPYGRGGHAVRYRQPTPWCGRRSTCCPSALPTQGRRRLDLLLPSVLPGRARRGCHRGPGDPEDREPTTPTLPQVHGHPAA